MKRLVLYSICIVLSCVTLCACSKREATAEDEQIIAELAQKSHQAEIKDDFPAMLKIAEEMQAFADQFKPDRRGRLMRAGANVKLGLAYSYLRKREEAFKAFDAVIADSDNIPPSLVMFAYGLKIMVCMRHRDDRKMQETITAFQAEYDKINASEDFRKDSAFRQAVRSSYVSAISGYWIYICKIKKYALLKKQIFELLAQFESENDFGRQLNESAAIFFMLSQAFRGEKDYEKELFYLKKSLYWAKQGYYVYGHLYLRLASHELQRGNFEQALAYCDSGLAEKKIVSNQVYAQTQAVLLFAKSKIYEKMGRPETAREYAEKARKLDPFPGFEKSFERWWIMEK